MKKLLDKLSKLNRQQKSMFLVLAFAGIGAALLVASQAATPTGVLSLTAVSGSTSNGTNLGSVVNGNNFTVAIYEDSGTQAVNSLSVGLLYDDAKLDFVSIDTSTSPVATGGCPEATGAAGKVTVVCYIAPTNTPNSVTGKKLVANVTFKAMVGGDVNTLFTFANESSELSALFNAGTGENIWNGVTTGGSYTLKTPDTTPPVITWTAPASGATVSGNSVTVSATVTDATAVSSVNMFIDASTTPLAMTASGSTYSANFVSTTVTDGSHTLTIKAKDPGNFESTATRTITVSNNKPNLTVATPTFDIAAPNTGNAVTISAIVTNGGTAAIPAGTAYSVAFKVDGTVIGTMTDNAGLAIGSSRTITLSPTKWTAAFGSHTITAEADSTSVITEVNESDNIGTKTVVVYTLGDVNNSGTVTITDLNTVLNNWKKVGQTRTTGDLNGDGTVTITDLNQVINNWTPL